MTRVARILYFYGAKYPTPSNLSWSRNWGILGLLMLGSQIVKGIVLAMHYVPNIDIFLLLILFLALIIQFLIDKLLELASAKSLFLLSVSLYDPYDIFYNKGVNVFGEKRISNWVATHHEWVDDEVEEKIRAVSFKIDKLCVEDSRTGCFVIEAVLSNLEDSKNKAEALKVLDGVLRHFPSQS